MELLKTGTTTLGIVCKDGIILAADRKVTLGGQLISSKKFDKVLIINEDIAVTTAGLVSDVQLLVKLMKAQLRLDELRKGKKLKARESASVLTNLVYQNVRKMSMIQGITGFLFGGRDNEGFYLYQLGMDGSITRYDDFTADGSGMVFALGALEAGYKADMTIDQGVKLAVQSVQAAIARDTASGGGFTVVTITKDGTKKVMEKQLEEKAV